jgi:hypothetical protein
MISVLVRLVSNPFGSTGNSSPHCRWDRALQRRHSRRRVGLPMVCQCGSHRPKKFLRSWGRAHPSCLPNNVVSASTIAVASWIGSGPY